MDQKCTNLFQQHWKHSNLNSRSKCINNIIILFGFKTSRNKLMTELYADFGSSFCTKSNCDTNFETKKLGIGSQN